MLAHILVWPAVLYTLPVVALLTGGSSCAKDYPIDVNMGKDTEIWVYSTETSGDGSDLYQTPTLPISLCARPDNRAALPFVFTWTAEHRIRQKRQVPTFILKVGRLGRRSIWAGDDLDKARPKGVINVQHEAGYLQVTEGVKVDCEQTDQAVFTQIENRYTLNQQVGSLRRVMYGPLDQAKDARGPIFSFEGDLFLWPLEPDGSNLLSVWRYPEDQAWWRMYPAEKMYSCIAKGKMPLEQLPTVIVDTFGVELKMPGETPEGADKPVIECRKRPPSDQLKCPDTMKTSKFKLVLNSPVRVRVSVRYSQEASQADEVVMQHAGGLQLNTQALVDGEQIDQWGKGTTVEISRPCNAPTEVTLDWFDNDAKLPGQTESGQGWDDRIKPVRTIKCTFEGWPLGGVSNATITLGGAKLPNPEVEKKESSAAQHHQLDPNEWWYCEGADEDELHSGQA